MVETYCVLKQDFATLFAHYSDSYDYLFGRLFEFITDHKPLLGLLKEDRPTSPQASTRIKRWSLFLSSYEYTLSFQKTGAHANKSVACHYQQSQVRLLLNQNWYYW